MARYIRQEEPKISRDGLIGTLLVHLLLLLCLWLVTLQVAWPIEDDPGILVNFGTTFEGGSGEVQPVNDASAKTMADITQMETANEAAASPSDDAPSKKTPKPVVNNKVQTVDDDKAPAIPLKDKKKDKDKKKKNKKKKKEKEQPETKKDTKNKTKEQPKENVKENAKDKAKDTPKPPEENTPQQPTIDPNALFPGTTSNSSTSQGNTNNSDVDLGALMGNVEISDNTSNNPSGLGDSGVNAALTGRKLLNDITPRDNSQQTGRVVIKIWVDKSGKVKDARFQSGGSTTSSSVLKNLALKAAEKAKFTAILEGPEVQTGTITFNFKVQ